MDFELGGGLCGARAARRPTELGGKSQFFCSPLVSRPIGRATGARAATNWRAGGSPGGAGRVFVLLVCRQTAPMQPRAI